MFARCHRNGNSLIADIYLPRADQKAIDENGNPNGKPIPTPILDLTPSMVESVEDCWKELGINLNDLAEKVAKPIQETFLTPIDDDDSPF